MAKLKQFWGYEDTHSKIKSEAAKAGVPIKDYLRNLVDDFRIPKNDKPKKIYQFP